MGKGAQQSRPGHKNGTGQKRSNQEYDLASICDDNIGGGLVCYVPMQAPVINMLPTFLMLSPG